MSPHEYETEVMAHRYLYYVLSESMLPDAVYDKLELAARVVCGSQSPVHAVGSSLKSSYTSEQINRAETMIGRHRAPVELTGNNI